jgi:hypothetical protein
MTREEIRRENARRLAKKVGGKAKFAKLVGIDGSRVSHIIGPNPTKNIGNSTSHRIELAFGFPRGYLDSDHPEIEDDERGQPVEAAQLSSVDVIPESTGDSHPEGWSVLTRVDATEHRLLTLYWEASARTKIEMEDAWVNLAKEDTATEPEVSDNAQRRKRTVAKKTHELRPTEPMPSRKHFE